MDHVPSDYGYLLVMDGRYSLVDDAGSTDLGAASGFVGFAMLYRSNPSWCAEVWTVQGDIASYSSETGVAEAACTTGGGTGDLQTGAGGTDG